MLRGLGVELIAADSPDSFVDDERLCARICRANATGGGYLSLGVALGGLEFTGTRSGRSADSRL